MDYLENSLQNVMKDYNMVMQYACDNNTTKFRSKNLDESKKMAMMKHERNVSK
jgi:hypothetical protein